MQKFESQFIKHWLSPGNVCVNICVCTRAHVCLCMRICVSLKSNPILRLHRWYQAEYSPHIASWPCYLKQWSTRGEGGGRGQGAVEAGGGSLPSAFCRSQRQFGGSNGLKKKCFLKGKPLHFDSRVLVESHPSMWHIFHIPCSRKLPFIKGSLAVYIFIVATVIEYQSMNKSLFKSGLSGLRDQICSSVHDKGLVDVGWGHHSKWLVPLPLMIHRWTESEWVQGWVFDIFTED